MTEKRRYCYNKQLNRIIHKTTEDYRVYDYNGIEEVLNSLADENEQLKQKITELKLGLDCSLALISIIQELCTAVLQYDFKDTENKVDFCRMLNEMDNKDLAFFKEVFTAIAENDINSMIKLKREVEGYLYG